MKLLRPALLALALLAGACSSDAAERLVRQPTTTTARPSMPAAGLVTASNADVVLLALDGAVVRTLPGWEYEFDEDTAHADLTPPTGPVVHLGQPTSSIERTDPPPNTTAPDGHVAGHWRGQWRSPDGHALLGFWSGECESPAAWITEDGGPWRPVIAAPDGEAAESYALGWSADGRAIAYFTGGICGTGIGTPGTYLVTPEGEATFVTDREAVASWRS